MPKRKKKERKIIERKKAEIRKKLYPFQSVLGDIVLPSLFHLSFCLLSSTRLPFIDFVDTRHKLFEFALSALRCTGCGLLSL